MAHQNRQLHRGKLNSPHSGNRDAQHTRNPRQTSSSGNELTAISAPYNFVPLAKWVYLPPWGSAVSHDVPFQDGYCGEIHYTLKAHTPLLVGGPRTPASSQKAGDVYPFKLPDGRYAIPGSSLKGMLRNVVEIAAFGRMRQIDSIRPALRDITGRHVAASYMAKLANVKAGFLVKRSRPTGNGEAEAPPCEIIPCNMARLEHRALEEAMSVQETIFTKGLSTGAKYERWQELCKEKERDPASIIFKCRRPGEDAYALFDESGNYQNGMPVFTGQISDSKKRGGKHRDFIFYDAREHEAKISVSATAWRDFLSIYGNDEPNVSRKSGSSWSGYWKQRYFNGERVPVFYIEEESGCGKQLRAFGLAYLLKIPGDFSTRQLLQHSAPAHAQSPGSTCGYDLADLLFGAVDEESSDASLRGRVFCETAVALGTPQEEEQGPVILGGPKPSYFPNYLTHPASAPSWKLSREAQYVTYIGSTQSGAKPTLRGFKRYPVRPDPSIPPRQDTGGNKAVQVLLHALPKDTQFDGRVVFHNLKCEELGALLWALTWGGDQELRHSLGMGKPFGFGQISIELKHSQSRLFPNAADTQRHAICLNEKIEDELMNAFSEAMDVVVKHYEKSGLSWSETPQLRNLTAMATPNKAKTPEGSADKGYTLRNMELNEFTSAKQNGLVLADYATVTMPTDQPQGSHTSTTIPTQEQWTNVTLSWDPGRRRLTVCSADGHSAHVEPADECIKNLPVEKQQTLFKKRQLEGAQATVEVHPKWFKLLKIDYPGR